ncbi:hypothetical protein CTP10_R65770 (plasmid) [Cupriavidus sp. P-10]|uniref:hypothetical protein n=1 Tax=Cupriavidus sp. P-10 TaxID=2027911 RepID=UPI000E2EA943|nr:hypothetical protein [Cupriavidus sp. P-10]BDB29164.1 hypothetical protein CTP10_R65770 [Cupriavidus sp. P-10]
MKAIPTAIIAAAASILTIGSVHAATASLNVAATYDKGQIHRPRDSFTDGARTATNDVYAGGARIDKRDVFTDGARIGPRDTFTDGGRMPMSDTNSL